MKWCVDMGYFEGNNIFIGKTIRGETRAGVQDKQFSEDELKLIFDPKNFLDKTVFRDSHIPLKQ